MIDADGDGYLDDLTTVPPPATGLRLGSAAGFVEPPLSASFSPVVQNVNASGEVGPIFSPWQQVATTCAGSGTVTITFQKLIDMTGDGRPDLVMSWDDSPNTCTPGPNYGYDGATYQGYSGWVVYPNRGLKTSQQGQYVDFGSPIHWPTQSQSIGRIEEAHSGTVLYTLVDVNGDGLADRIYANISQAYVQYGTGAGFVGNAGSAGTFVLPTLSQQPFVVGAQSAGTGVSCSGNTLADINGDGFLDRVRAVAFSNTWWVAFGNGSGFSANEVAFAGSQPSCVTGTNISLLVDVDGDGLPDSVTNGATYHNLGAVQSTGPDAPSAVIPGLLLSATDPMGGVTEFTYQTAPQMTDAGGNPANPGFQFPRPVVVRIRHLDAGGTVLPIVTDYSYLRAKYDYA